MTNKKSDKYRINLDFKPLFFIGFCQIPVRYDRVIIGGNDSNYKPKYIFGQNQSQISLKLFGELNMEDFPVNQAKDGFIWEGGLEEEFLKNLKEQINDYIEIASMSKKDRINEENLDDNNSDIVQKEVEDSFEGITLDLEYDDNSANNEETLKTDANLGSEAVLEYEKCQKEENKQNTNFASKVRVYSIKIDPINVVDFSVTWKIGNSDKWIEFDQSNNNISINLNHPFFKPYSSNIEFIALLEKFVVTYVCAIQLAEKASIKEIGEKTFILPSVLTNKINSILKKISEKK